MVAEHLVHLDVVRRLVVRQRFDATLGQVRLRLFDQRLDPLVVTGLGVGQVERQHHLVRHIDEQVQFVPEPLDHFGHLALGVLGLLAPATRLRQAVGDLGLPTCLVRLAAALQGGGVAGGVHAQIRHSEAQTRDHVVEALPHQFQVLGLTEDREEAGQVPPVRDGVLALDADQQSEGGVAAEFFETGFGGGVPQQDGEQEDPPEDADGVVVAAAVATGLEGGEQGGVGDGFEGVSDGAETGRGVHLVPGEERFGDVHDHGELLEREGLREDAQRAPAQPPGWGKNPGKVVTGAVKLAAGLSSWGTPSGRPRPGPWIPRAA